MVTLLGAALWWAWKANEHAQQTFATETAIHDQTVQERISDFYLTMQARSFAITGEPRYLENYWNEVNVKHTNENVMNALDSYDLTHSERDLLNQITTNYVALEDTEARSMRLVLEAQGVPVADMPARVAEVKLTSDEQAMSPQQKKARAALILSDDAYDQAKQSITAPLDQFSTSVAQRLDGEAASDQTSANVSYLILIVVILVALIGIPLLILLYQRRLRATLRDSALSLAANAHEILATAEEQERTAAQQSASIEQTTSTMVELDATSELSATRAGSAVARAEETLELTAAGSQHVGRLQTVATELTERSEEVTTQIDQLGIRIDQVRGISEAVRDLAVQTNLLALNAAVEAARAGEAGRGFSVVAAEIRKLADESAEAADRISSLVVEVQQGADRATRASRAGATTVIEMSKLTTDEGRLLDDISTAAHDSADGVREILLNMRQQSAAVSEVMQAMAAITAGARETASSSTQLRAGVESINESVSRLTGLV